MQTTTRITVAVMMALLVATPGISQEAGGILDLNRSIEQQIIQLEGWIGGDSRAQFQAVVLQWLIELYSSVGRNDDVERCYDRILAYFPQDVATRTAYGRFLMETVEDYERAQKVLQDAHEWGRATDVRGVELGNTFAVRAELMRRMGNYETSVNMANSALRLIGFERSAPALRTLAKSLHELKRYDEAADAYLRLIALESGANADDINALKLFISKTTNHDTGSMHERIDEAIEEHRKHHVAEVEQGGGTVTQLEATDGLPLEGTLRNANGPGAVLFVHDIGGRRSAFTPYAQLLFIDEISSLAVDLRGHGDSRADSMLSYEQLSTYNRDKLPDDIVSAYRHLQKTVGLAPERVAIVAAGQSSALVEKALYRGRIRAPVVYLSPVFSDSDRELNTALSFHGDDPALIITAKEDLASLRALRMFETTRSRKKRTQLTRRVYQDAGHGVETLRRLPEALEDLQAWLRRVLAEG